MRSFVDLERELHPRRFLGSVLGTLYLARIGAERIIIRRFDNALSTALVPAYVDLVNACQLWLNDNPQIGDLVEIVKPIEVGEDFVARPYHVYLYGIDAYSSDEVRVEPPTEWHSLRAAFKKVPKPTSDRDSIVLNALGRSLLQPNHKTYFDENRGRFVVMDPRFTAEDVHRWVVHN